jgi:hypothetical protein
VGNPIPFGVQDHSFVAQGIFDLNKQVAKLETSLESVGVRLTKVEDKLGQTSSDVASIKTTLETLKPIAKSVGRAIWTLVTIVATFGLTVLGMWLKHKMGW